MEYIATCMMWDVGQLRLDILLRVITYVTADSSNFTIEQQLDVIPQIVAKL